MTWKGSLLCLRITVAVVGWAPAAADLGDVLYHLPNPDPGLADQYGEATAASGNSLLVGASRDDSPGASDDAGVVYLYDLTTGQLQLTIPNPGDDPAYDAFGAAVSIDGTRIAVGAPFDGVGGTERGSAYIYDTHGDLLHTLVSPYPSDGGQFGVSAAVEGDAIGLGEPGTCMRVNEACGGAAYLFQADTGGLLNVFANPSPDPFDRFGASIAVGEACVVVGAPGEEAGGAVYVFDRTTGDLIRVLYSPFPTDFAQFGAALAVDGNAIVIGAPFGDTSSNQDGAGAAYIFDAGTGRLRVMLTNPTPSVSEQFGRAVSLGDGVVAVGAPFDSTPGTTDIAGAAHLFDEATGDHLATFSNPSPGFRDAFGYAVAASPSGIAVGAFRDNSGASRSGAVFVFGSVSRNQPPRVTEAFADIQEIWPANGKMIGVKILGVSDPDGDPVVVTVETVTQDEPVGLLPDATGVGSPSVNLRAERGGQGNGRIYRITFVATDPFGASSEGSVLVAVPHDRRSCGGARDDGQRYDATVAARSKPALLTENIPLRNSPNPFNPATRIEYRLAEPGPVSLVVYNTLGQAIRVLTDGYLGSGLHAVRWDGRDGMGRQVSSGLYIAHLMADGRFGTHRMLLAK